MISFLDVDECSTGGNLCQRYLATCTNTIGSYTCACKEGYTGDGRQCVGVLCNSLIHSVNLLLRHAILFILILYFLILHLYVPRLCTDGFWFWGILCFLSVFCFSCLNSLLHTTTIYTQKTSLFVSKWAVFSIKKFTRHLHCSNKFGVRIISGDILNCIRFGTWLIWFMFRLLICRYWWVST